MALAVFLPDVTDVTDVTEGEQTLNSPMRLIGACLAMAVSIACIVASLDAGPTTSEEPMTTAAESVSILR